MTAKLDGNSAKITTKITEKN